jgi:tetratricopeptide (TPR) repeat protein
VKVAPKYADAWDNLGTIAFQTGKYRDAEGYFRRALKHEPGDFSFLVNLGGVLVALERHEEALAVNQKAYELRSEDALANAQLGMSYFHLGDEQRAIEYLTAAKKSDPAHFTYPQLILARIYSRQGESDRVVAELQDFLERHPDSEESASVRRWLTLAYENGDAGLAEVAEAIGPTPCDW